MLDFSCFLCVFIECDFWVDQVILSDFQIFRCLPIRKNRTLHITETTVNLTKPSNHPNSALLISLVDESEDWVPTQVGTRHITFADTWSVCDVIGLVHTKSRYTSPWGVRVWKQHWHVPTRVGTIAAVCHNDDCPIRGSSGIQAWCFHICGWAPLLDLKHWSSMAEMRDLWRQKCDILPFLWRPSIFALIKNRGE